MPPLVLEWLPGSDTIGDFVWPGLREDLVVVERVARDLEDHFSGFELYSVEMFQEERLYNLKRKPRKPIILLPYKGPKLYDVWVTKVVNIDLGRSSVKKMVSDTGEATYEAEGLEEYKGEVDAKTLELSYQHIQREQGKGLYVNIADLGGCDLFHIEEFFGFKYCTNKLKHHIEEKVYKNVRFLEVGEAI